MHTRAFWIAANAAVLIGCLLSSVLSYAVVRPGGFMPLGPGGGGAMFFPTVSPHDPNTVLIATDMTGAYITHDGGQSWRMFNLRGVIRFFVFDPIDRETIYAANQALWRSTDDGKTWKVVYPAASAIVGVRTNPDHADETIIAEPNPIGTILALAIDPADRKVLYVTARKSGTFGLFISRDFGASWQELNRLSDEPRRIWIDPHSPEHARTLFIAGSHSLMVKNAEGLRGFPSNFEMRDVSLGFASDGRPIVYAVSPSGLFISQDAGKSWTHAELPANGARLRMVATSLGHGEVAYISFSHLREGDDFWSRLRGGGREWFGVAKTTDTGKSWRFAWKESNTPADNISDAWVTQRFGPGWAENPLAIGVADQDPNLVYTTDYGRALKTEDGGEHWAQVCSRRIGTAWASTGLDVTSSHGVHFDPFDKNRIFVTHTDIGLFRSEDGGKSWQSSAVGAPKEWDNTTYWLVFDPEVQGRMWSVNSNTHDLPRPKVWQRRSVLDYKGGVCRSDDGGRTWVKSNDGMDETAATHIIMDERSPVGARVLYVAGFGRGVYKSIDGGHTWSLKNTGITQTNPLAYRLAMDSRGTLYVMVVRKSQDGTIGNDGDGAIYRSSDGAEHWQRVSLPERVNGPNGLAIDPESPQRIYLAAWARAIGMHGDGGGIFLSTDGGNTWRQVLDRDRHVFDVTIDPRNSRVLYATGFESSAWISEDRGEHWRRIAGFNFKWAHRVIPDPGDPRSVYITTFGGGVWHGRVDGKPAIEDIATPELAPGGPGK